MRFKPSKYGKLVDVLLISILNSNHSIIVSLEMDTNTRYGIPYIDVDIEEENAEIGCIELLKVLRSKWPSDEIQTKV